MRREILKVRIKLDIEIKCVYQDKAIKYYILPKDLCIKGVRSKRVDLLCWYKPKIQAGTRWDMEPITIVLDEIEIEK